MNKKLTYIFTLALLIINGMVMAQQPAHVTIGGSVFGGGNLAKVEHKTKVVVDQTGAEIAGDVYGGGALANVGTNPADSTIVNIYQGNLQGNVYGGGLGKLDPTEGGDTIAAKVYGKVFVNIGYMDNNEELQGSASFNVSDDIRYGNVFGCNNICGSPMDSVFVNIYKTAHTDYDTCPTLITNVPQLHSAPNTYANYAIKAVYGGGNKASYEPNKNADNSKKCTTVHVYGCTENTVQTIYGGGNAANVGMPDTVPDYIEANTRLIIEGGRFNRIFGGGNGYSETGNHGINPSDPRYYDETSSNCTTTVSATPCPDYNPGACIYGQASTFIYGGFYYQVFGGSNQYGDIKEVSLTIDKQNCGNLLIEESFGGANEADITSNISTTLLCNDYSIGSFYGGSNKADINGDVTLNVRGGNYTNVFGGSKGTKTTSTDPDEIALASADINGNVTLNLHGGTMVNAFGGSDVFGSISGAITVNVWDTVSGCPLQVDTIYGGGQDAAYTPDLVAGKKIVSPVVNLWNGTVGHVESSGTIPGCVFGGGKGEGAVVTAHPKVMIGDTSTVNNTLNNHVVTLLGSTAGTYGNVFGGGNAAAVVGIDSVIVLRDYQHVHVSNLFGGGNRANADSTVVLMNVNATVDTIFGGGNLAGLSGTAEVTVSNGTVKGGIYGGSNADGTVAKEIVVNVLGGTVGADGAPANIHGGGYGADTRTNGHVTVNYGNNPTTHSDFPKVYGDIYGGSALGEVNAGNDTTMINVLNGTVYGDIYGGGLGDNSNPAKVNGKVYVNIGKLEGTTLQGEAAFSDTTMVFGCNNANGSPQDSVFVNIYHTAHTTTPNNTYPSQPAGGWTVAALATNSANQQYAIQAVYGGGNEAAYTPAQNTSGNPRKSTTVHVYGCQNNTIKDVYGGGNAADVGTDGTNANTFVIIDGGRINRVFGGGKGVAGTGGVEANIYGTATTTVYAGLIDTIFGGSNQNGAIKEANLVLANATSSTCNDKLYNQVFGGANVATIAAPLTTTINCGVGRIGDIYGGSNLANITGNVTLNVKGGEYDNVFGGSRGDEGQGNGADITGNVELNLEGGTMANAFGGSNVQGNITGTITVNMLDQGDCPLVVDTIYGAGQKASYTPTVVSGKKIVSPVVNLLKGTVGRTDNDGNVTHVGCVFGAGKGSGADITAHPKVIIGDTLSTHGSYVAKVLGNVFGGGNAAEVDGIDSVLMLKSNSQVVNLFGGGNAATADSTVVMMTAGAVDTIFGGGNLAGLAGTARINMNGGTANKGIYGGCNAEGTVDGMITVEVNGGQVGASGARANVHGGGYGSQTMTNDSVMVVIGNGAGTPAIYGDVYGGSALGTINSKTGTINTIDSTFVVIKRGEVYGDVYGGGLGNASNEAWVYSPVRVSVIGGSVSTYSNGTKGGNVFGCNNVKGAPKSTVRVDINKTESGQVATNVFGGGNFASYEFTPDVNLIAGTVDTIFGGGNQAGVGGGDVTMTGGIAKGGVYGGCNTSGTVEGKITVEVNDGQVGASDARANVHGGGYGAATMTNDSVMVVIGNGNGTPVVYGDVYGGSALGTINSSDGSVNNADTTFVAIKKGTVYGDVYGGGLGNAANEAWVYSPVRVSVTGGLVSTYSNGTKGGNVFGCNNKKGAPKSTVRVDINRPDGNTIATNVFGGGNLADYSGIPVVNYINGTVDTIFGGGNQAGVGGGDVTMKGGTVNWGVYGGCNASGNVDGRIKVNIEGGTIGIAENLNATNPKVANVFGGGYGALTSTSGDVEVNFGVNSGSHNEYPKLYGDIYGGSALGSVNNNHEQDTTYVNILNGTIYTQKVDGGATSAGPHYYIYYGGNVYGGGLGEDGALNVGKGKVYGPIIVNVGDSIPQTGSATLYVGYASIGGNVYGCNNTNGSPEDNVTVNIFGTNHTTGDEASNTAPTATFAIDNVFGGGNKASYTANKQATVRIFGCENTIERSFGGGNAAAAPNVLTDIQGGRFKEVYGGGNGELIAANVTGNVDLYIHGGNVGMFFAGSNQQGSISGATTVTVDNDGPCGTIDIDEFFCGGNYANFVGDIDATISCSQNMHVRNLYGGCNQANVVDNPATTGVHEGNIHLTVYGGEFENVYGGSKGTLSKPANIEGNVTLDIYGGEIDTVFGGSNINGNVYGNITVNILDLEHNLCGLTVHNVYGGGRDASYTPTTPGDYPEVNIINGWVSKKTPTSGGNVFGGGYGVKATVSSDPKVRIGYDAVTMSGLLPTQASLPDGYSLPGSYRAKVDSLVFGGGDLAAVAGTTKVTIQQDNSIAHSLFGGGNNASVGNATVEVLGGSVTAGVYGGCNTSGSVGGQLTADSTFVGAIAVNLNGGTIGVNGTTTDVVFGGGYGHNTFTTGNIGVTLNGTTVYGNLYGGSALGSVNAGTGNTSTVTLTSATLHGSVFGGGMGSGTGEGTKATSLGNATVNVNVHNTNLTGIYGGANINGDVAGDINVYIDANVGANGHNRDIYGGGLGQYTTTGGNVTVAVGNSSTPVIYGNIYGGSEKGEVGATGKIAKVDFKKGTLNGILFGGGKGQATPAISATVSGGTEVAVTDGTITGGIYGGCNERGTVKGNITVGIDKGTIGINNTASNDGVFGGGLGEATTTEGTITVNIASEGAFEGPIIYGDIYGGSGFGQVSAAGKLTQVNFHKGTINGDIYGGGLGDEGKPAEVSGNVEINIKGGVFNKLDGTSGGGQIFGCNNAQGTPKGDVVVNIYSTDHGDDVAHNLCPAAGTITTAAQLATNFETQTYAIAAVYGGGNLAAYVPTKVTEGDPHSTTVHVYNCNNTIKDVYGGGNAANVGSVGSGAVTANTNIVIEGGRINRVFGGGNGEQEPANIYGTASTTVKAGLIDQIFGGGNMQGSINSTSLILNHENSICDEVFREVFGGANKASIEGDLLTTIECGVGTIGDIYGGSNEANVTGNVQLDIEGGSFDNVFGGSKGVENGTAANILAGSSDKGNVTLNLYGGTIANAFGGSNYNGNIQGKIMVNVNDQGSQTCPLKVTNIYGASNLATYTPNENKRTNSPSVYIKNVKSHASATDPYNTVKGNVFGGGKGATATVTSNPLVVVGDSTLTSGNLASIDLNVYGGGDLAVLSGSSKVLLQKSNSVVSQDVFGGGNKAGVTSTQVDITGGSISRGLYGGCNETGTVSGDIVVNVKSNLGAYGAPMTDGIFGGGKGGYDDNLHPGTHTAGNITVTIGEGTTPTLYADVYGGSAFGQVGAANTLTKVDLQAGTVNGTIYGGGKGQLEATTPVVLAAYVAEVTGATEVDINGNVTGGVYGGCNVNGIVKDNTTVNITGGTLDANVYGGGLGENTKVKGDVAVTVNGASATVNGDVYGGSAKGLVNCNESGTASGSTTEVTLNAGTINGSFYGGGHGISGAPANVFGPVAVIVNGGTVTGSVYGCNNAAGAPQSTVKVDVYRTDMPTSGYALANVFGGGNQAAYAGTPEVTIHNCDNKIEYVYGGGNQASVVGTNVKVYGGNTIGYVFGGGNGQGVATDYTMVSGNAEANIYGGTIEHVFGGNNSSGAIIGDITVNVDKSTAAGACDMKVQEVYGGGNRAAGKAGTINIGCTGSLTADHYAHPERIGTTLEGIGTVYGGSNAANVSNSVELNINDGIINKVFGGNNDKDTIQGTITVNIEKTGSCDWYVGEVYGGGNHAPYGGTPAVNIIEGTIYRNIYGGGNDITADTIANNPRGVNGSNVVMRGGTVLGGVYGGCKEKGSVATDALVTIQRGTIGSQDQLTAGTVANVFGGGLGANTKVAGNVTVNFGNKPTTPGAPNANLKLYGDIYGGSALGSVNTTVVNVLDGTLFSKTDTLDILVNHMPTGRKYVLYTGGNVFGGGLGEEGVTTKGRVYGKIEVNIGAPNSTRGLDPVNDTCVGNATIGGSVYGCNNTGGSPQDDVEVNIYRTYRRDKDQITYIDEDATYAIANVFGGGNKANYTATDKTATVNIASCYNTIRRVFGGSNAAAAPHVTTKIQGGRFAEVFGGGNGEVQAANITGNVNLEIHGGIVGEFFVGSNQNGTISGTSNVTVDQTSGCEEVSITEFYCGGKYADFVGDINATITCSQGMHVDYLYGGCKEAHVVPKGTSGTSDYEPGNVTLTVKGGTFKHIFGGSKGTSSKGADIAGDVTLNIYGGTVSEDIFGGSNVKGAIGGSITVNVEQGSGPDYCPLDVSLADVYGGGNKADYPGEPASDSPITGSNTHTPPYNYPQVNIKNATVKNVFGGGLEAKVTGNPEIKIKKGSKILGNVYGGGNMGEVDGDPKVIINGKLE